ncbi:uncharacterized protein [Gossypium hirsutum]|uniref:Retrotransposon gag domain-containing protein n=1 Tax=Gossypium hirsutum TaxID=3635 RepID=A0A1U8KTS7_GOSHI|nr:uncharacterized protein LOC107919111 [Gossypium hirsutum]
MEATEHIMDDLGFTAEQKFKGAIPLLRDEAYQWWLTVRDGTQPDSLTWDLFNTDFQSKYVRASYIDARRREFLNLTQGDRSVAEYEADFLRLSHYAQGMDFSVLVKKAKIAEEVKHAELQNRDRGKAQRDVEVLNVGVRPRKKTRSDGPVRVGSTVASAGVVICQLCSRRHPSECWRFTRACLRCGSSEHCVKDCPLRTNQMQAPATEAAQPPRVVQQPPRGRGHARGGNGMGRGQKAPG